VTRPSRPPPFLCQFFLPSFLGQPFRLRLSPRLSNRPFPFRRSWLTNRLQLPQWRRASRGQVARQPQLLRKFLLLDSGGGLFRNLVRDRDLWLSFFSGSRFLMVFLCPGTRWTARSGRPLVPHPFVRTRWGTEMSTPRSLKICAIRCTLSPLRCASKISSLYCLNASILGCFR
jgi:hypothetical protein